jgi:hypothetical protein
MDGVDLDAAAQLDAELAGRLRGFGKAGDAVVVRQEEEADARRLGALDDVARRAGAVGIDGMRVQLDALQEAFPLRP